MHRWIIDNKTRNKVNNVEFDFKLNLSEIFNVSVDNCVGSMF